MVYLYINELTYLNINENGELEIKIKSNNQEGNIKELVLAFSKNTKIPENVLRYLANNINKFTNAEELMRLCYTLRNNGIEFTLSKEQIEEVFIQKTYYPSLTFEIYKFLKEFNLLTEEYENELAKAIEEDIDYIFNNAHYDKIKPLQDESVLKIFEKTKDEQYSKLAIKSIRFLAKELLDHIIDNMDMIDWIKNHNSSQYVSGLLLLFTLIRKYGLEQEFKEEIERFRNHVIKLNVNGKISEVCKKRMAKAKYKEEVIEMIRLLNDTLLLKYLL
jgi:ribosomal protein L25 (general stress protein Ctc)